MLIFAPFVSSFFMSYVLQIQKYKFREIEVQLLVPSDEQLFAAFRQEKEPCPYWGQVWPAALGLSQYLVDHPASIKGLDVMELAGGLGLPSLVAAHFAKSVCCSDYIADAVSIVAQSARLNQLDINTEIIDWNDIPREKIKEVVLLSDINYEPDLFDRLHTVLLDLWAKNVKIILSTPQRLLAKPFIERLLPFVVEQSEVRVLNKAHMEEWISIFVCSKTK